MCSSDLAGMAAATPIAIVENASLPNVRHLYTHLGQLAVAAAAWELSGPAVILLGEVYRQGVATMQPALSCNHRGGRNAYPEGTDRSLHAGFRQAK